MKLHFRIDRMIILDSHQAVPPTFCNKIVPMHRNVASSQIKRSPIMSAMCLGTKRINMEYSHLKQIFL